MNNDGVVFVMVVVSIMGIAKLIYDHINLNIEVKNLRKRLGIE